MWSAGSPQPAPLNPLPQAGGATPRRSGLVLSKSGLTAEMKRHCAESVRLSHGVPQVTRNLCRHFGMGPPTSALMIELEHVVPKKPAQSKLPIFFDGESMKLKV